MSSSVSTLNWLLLKSISLYSSPISNAASSKMPAKSEPIRAKFTGNGSAFNHKINIDFNLLLLDKLTFVVEIWFAKNFTVNDDLKW